jgi:hypothetical protein
MLGFARRPLRLIGVLILPILPTSLASAAPPASCANKFVGTWVYPGGTTVVAPGGIAYPQCAMCVPTQTWTCQGNTYLFSNSGPPGQFSATLSPDGRQLIGGGVVATRVGGAAPGSGAAGKSAAAPGRKESAGDKKDAAPQKPTRIGNAKPPEVKPEAKPQASAAKSSPAAPADALPRRSASCSDITGTSNAAPAASNCRDADRSLYAARQLRQVNPQVAAAEYKKAAAAARSAGDGTLELSILREAMEAAATVAASGASAGAPAPPAAATPSPPAAGGLRRMWDGSRETCDTANKTERISAAWHVMCDPQPPARPVTAHRPNPDPQELSKAARQVCGSYSRDTQQCFADFKLKAILAENPGLREICERKAADQSPLRRQLSERLGGGSLDNRRRFLECVDNVYLYGSTDGPPSPKHALRETLRKMLAAKASEGSDPPATDGAPKRSLCWSPGRCCQPGHGLKPTPGAFGAWSCQPLGVLALGAAQPPIASKATADLVEDLEDRVNETVANAVTAALDALGPGMSETDREVCTAASFAAVHAMLKGGAPDVPERCRAMASGARGYFTTYAQGHVDNSSGAVEDLLASFAGDLGAPLPGMTGLAPDESLRRFGECLLRGGSQDNCN